MEQLWSETVINDFNYVSFLKQHSSSSTELETLLLVLKRWLSLKHDDDQEIRCWNLVAVLSKSAVDWHSVEFLCRELLLRSGSQELRPVLLLAATALNARFTDQWKLKCNAILNSFLIESEEDPGKQSLQLLIESLSLIFPICVEVCRNLLVSDELQRQLLRKISLNDENLVLSLLRLLDVACVDDSTRSFISENYIKLLEQALEVQKFKVPTALVLIKIWSFTKLQKETFESCVASFLGAFLNEEHIEESIEAFAYLTLKPSVRNLLRSSGDICLKFVEMVKSEETTQSQLYGLLVILANLGKYPANSEETIDKLRTSLKNAQSRDTEQDLENGREIDKFNRDYILDLSVIGALSQRTLSSSSLDEAMRILFNVTRQRDMIIECVKQGGGVMVLSYLAQKRQGVKDEHYISAIRVISKILIHVNPSTAFNKYSPLNATPFLFEVIPSPKPEPDDELFNFTTLDTYEALLALTNLATINQGTDLGKLITSKDEYWDTIESLLLDPTIEIQRSVLELIANLIANPVAIAAKFFNFDNPRSAKNFSVLVKLLELHDVRSQQAVAAIFANIASTVPFISEQISRNEELVQTVIRVLTEQIDDTDLRDRILVLLISLLQSNSQLSEQFKNNLELINCLKKCQNQKYSTNMASEISTEILKLIN